MGRKILIIGNGFDLNLGLPTSYSHFLGSSHFKEILNTGNKIAEYLRDQMDIQNWVDVELSIKKYADKVSQDDANFGTFRNDYKGLVERFSEYLRSIDISTIDVQSHAYNFLVENAITQSKVADIRIYNFNYTPTVKRILNNHGWPLEVIEGRHVHVHGELNNNLIFGIQDETSPTRFHSLVKKSMRPGFKTCNISDELLKGNNIEIFGYSLGETDEMYFSLPFSTLSRQSNMKSNMNIYYYGEDARDALNFRLDRLTRNKMLDFQKSVSLNWIPISE